MIPCYFTLEEIKLLRWATLRLKDHKYIKSKDNTKLNLIWNLLNDKTHNELRKEGVPC